MPQCAHNHDRLYFQYIVVFLLAVLASCPQMPIMRASSIAGWSSLVARRAHNPKVVGSNPAPASKDFLQGPFSRAFFVVCVFAKGGVLSREERVTELLQPVVESMGFEWVGVEYHHNSVNAILRIYVDKPEGGIDMDGVVAVTEVVNPILDVEDPINAPYTLEVSSPGLDRPLFSFADFVRFTGATAKVHLHAPIGKRRRFEWVIESTDEATQRITFAVQQGRAVEALEVDYANVDKARLVPDF